MIQIDLEIPKCCDECKFVYDSCKCIITGSCIDWDKCDSERLLDCPLNKIAEPYKGMTNGEVIRMLYPQGEIVKGLYGISGNPLICVNLNISTECSEMVLTEDWWNSPYNPQEGANE